MGRLWVWIPPDVCFFPSSTLLSLLTLCYCNVECPKSSPSRSSCSTKDIEFVKLKFNLCCFGYLGVKWEERMPTRDSNHLWKPTVADLRLVTTNKCWTKLQVQIHSQRLKHQIYVVKAGAATALDSILSSRLNPNSIQKNHYCSN